MYTPDLQEAACCIHPDFRVEAPLAQVPLLPSISSSSPLDPSHNLALKVTFSLSYLSNVFPSLAFFLPFPDNLL